MTRLTVKGLERAIHEKRGNLSAVARAFGVDRSTVWRRVQKSGRLQDAVKTARETMLDAAENTLYEKALEGSTAELIFFLKTQGKSRGYTERQEHEHSGPGGGAIQFIDYGLSNAGESDA